MQKARRATGCSCDPLNQCPPPALLPFLLGTRFGHLTIAYVFSYQTMHARNAIGRLVVATHLLNAAAAAAQMVWIVERAKKCLDFSSTCYIWHLVFCWAYGGFPRSLTWCALVCVYVCLSVFVCACLPGAVCNKVICTCVCLCVCVCCS